VSSQLHAPAALPQGKRLQYPMDMDLGGSQSRSGYYGDEKDFALAENRNPVVHPVVRNYTDGAIPTTCVCTYVCMIAYIILVLVVYVYDADSS
jgi:hypothetical protein